MFAFTCCIYVETGIPSSSPSRTVSIGIFSFIFQELIMGTSYIHDSDIVFNNFETGAACVFISDDDTIKIGDFSKSVALEK